MRDAFLFVKHRIAIHAATQKCKRVLFTECFSKLA